MTWFHGDPSGVRARGGDAIVIGHVLRYALLFLLPFLLYGAWLAVARYRAQGHRNDPNWEDVPLLRLSVAGLALVIVGLFSLALFQGEDTGGTYIPPRVQDGVVAPGEIRR